MSIPRYRIGNDLTVLWAINNRDGSPYDLSQKEVRLFVTHPRDRIEVEAVVETLPGGEVNNVIRWDFSGLDQRVLGKYMLTAEIYTSEDKKLIRKDISEAFALVSRSEMENEEGGEEVMDGGELFLSSKLDIYRFGIPKIKIGTNGNWYIDGVDTRVSALGGGPGLVNEVYTHEDFDKTFDPSSVVDAFNAYAVASLARRLRVLEADDYLQIRNMTDVLYVSELQNGQVLVWDGTRWTNKEPQGGAGGSGIIDMTMSDTSENAVANRIIKAYADLSPKYKVVGEVVEPETPGGDPGEGGTTPSASAPRMKLRHIDGILYVESDIDLADAKIQLGRLGRSYSRGKGLDGYHGRKKKNGWRIYNPTTKKADNYNSDTRLTGMRLVHRPRLDFPDEYRYAIEFVTDNLETTDAKYALASSFGTISTDEWHMSTSHGTKTIGIGSSASQTFAVVINGLYLPFRLFMQMVDPDEGCTLGLTPI